VQANNSVQTTRGIQNSIRPTTLAEQRAGAAVHRLTDKEKKSRWRRSHGPYLVRAEDFGVVVEVAEGGQGVVRALELDKAVPERLAHHLALLWLPVIHHPALGRQRA